MVLDKAATQYVVLPLANAKEKVICGLKVILMSVSKHLQISSETDLIYLHLANVLASIEHLTNPKNPNHFIIPFIDNTGGQFETDDAFLKEVADEVAQRVNQSEVKEELSTTLVKEVPLKKVAVKRKEAEKATILSAVKGKYVVTELFNGNYALQESGKMVHVPAEALEKTRVYLLPQYAPAITQMILSKNLFLMEPITILKMIIKLIQL